MSTHLKQQPIKKRFRMPCQLTLYQGNGRPEKPPWMQRGNKKNATRNQKRSLEYWSHIWQATPPWVDENHVEAFRVIYESCPADSHCDHIIPLRCNIVCGLHVPWNLQHLPIKENYYKSNTYWPDMPGEQLELFK